MLYSPLTLNMCSLNKGLFAETVGEGGGRKERTEVCLVPALHVTAAWQEPALQDGSVWAQYPASPASWVPLYLLPNLPAPQFILRETRPS